MSKKDYYVYEVLVDGVVRYIGMGRGNRYLHAVSGKSSCVELNEDYFDNKIIAISKAITDVTENVAAKEEARLILKYGLGQLYNKRSGRSVITSLVVPHGILKLTNIDGNVITSTEKMVYAYLLSLKGKHIHPSATEISKYLGIGSRQAVMDALGKLSDYHGLITIKKTEGKRSEYKIN